MNRTHDVPHRLQVTPASVTAVRERVERHLGVETLARPEGEVWAIYFDAPKDVDLDFLRPDVLPPKSREGGGGSLRGGAESQLHDKEKR